MRSDEGREVRAVDDRTARLLHGFYGELAAMQNTLDVDAKGRSHSRRQFCAVEDIRVFFMLDTRVVELVEFSEAGSHRSAKVKFTVSQEESYVSQ